MLDPMVDILSLSISIIALLLVIFFQYLRQKPILSFRIVRNRHYYIESYKQLGADIEIAVDNTGERGTTIHDVKLLNAVPSEIYELLKTSDPSPYDYETDVPPHSTKPFSYMLASEKGARELSF